MTPAEFLKRYSREPRLIPLNRLGVGKLNRGGQPLNGCHVETLMRRWHKGPKSGGEDFQTYRYKPARVYEPNPLDPQETLRHTSLMAAKDSRIRPVSDDTGKGLYSLFSKSHCWSALWGLTGRCMRLSARDGEESFVIAPPRDQSELAFAEEHGLWCEVVRWEGVANHPHVLKELMKSENYDAKSALAEDEVSLFRDVYDMLHQGGCPNRRGRVSGMLSSASSHPSLATSSNGVTSSVDITLRSCSGNATSISSSRFAALGWTSRSSQPQIRAFKHSRNYPLGALG